MAMPVSTIEHRGHRILYVDYRNLGEPECVQTLREHAAVVEAAPAPVLTLVDARGAVFGGEFIRAAKVAEPRNTSWTVKRAAIGVEGVKEMMLAFFNASASPAPIRPFATLDEALAYLTEP
jgi:hypothetical protein